MVVKSAMGKAKGRSGVIVMSGLWHLKYLKVSRWHKQLLSLAAIYLDTGITAVEGR